MPTICPKCGMPMGAATLWVCRPVETELATERAAREAVERERDEARKYLSAAAADYDKLLAYLETSYQSAEVSLPFEEAFAAAAKECRETSDFLRHAAEGRQVGYIYDDELTVAKSRATAAEADNAKLRAALESAVKLIRAQDHVMREAKALVAINAGPLPAIFAALTPPGEKT